MSDIEQKKARLQEACNALADALNALGKEGIEVDVSVDCLTHSICSVKRIEYLYNVSLGPLTRTEFL